MSRTSHRWQALAGGALGVMLAGGSAHANLIVNPTFIGINIPEGGTGGGGLSSTKPDHIPAAVLTEAM